MQFRPTIHFPGNARDAIALYRTAFGGELDVTTFAGSPAESEVPPDWADRVLYARLQTAFGAIDLMDAPPGRERPSGGNVAVAIDLEDEARAHAIFERLADGGEVLMPFVPTFWAHRFGMVADRFGVRWLIGVPVAQVIDA